MWIEHHQLARLGFKRSGERFRKCERRFHLRNHDHITIWSWSEQRSPEGSMLVELTEFHVTFYRGGERLHFYWHERDHNEWESGGHTSTNEIRRVQCDPVELRSEATAIAEAFIAALGGRMFVREE
jgi:hypothetical protein